MPRGTDYEALRQRLKFVEDGRPIREVGGWTLNKLALLAYYLPEFAGICQRKARGWYFVDGFAGNGANRSPDFPVLQGTALIGVTATPAAQRCILVERSRADFETLRARVEPYGDRVVCRNGDANAILSGLLRTELQNDHLPGLCVLDPEGLELAWTTVEACATRRSIGSPYELLIYFSTPGAARSAAVRDESLAAIIRTRLTAVFGGSAWEAIAEQQLAGKLAPGEAGSAYLGLYERQLRGLGYTHIEKRASVRQDGGLVYHIVFATANEAGGTIMESAFRRAFVQQLPLQF